MALGGGGSQRLPMPDKLALIDAAIEELGRSLKNCELVRMRSDELPAELTDSPGD